MKKTLAVLAAFLLTAGSTFAQSADMAPMGPGNRMGQGRGGNLTPEQRADMQTQRLTKALSLTADQATQIRTIALAENQELQALRGKFASADSRQGAMQEVKALREKYDTQIKAVLTADQATRFNQLREEQLDKRKDKVRGNQKPKNKA